MGGIAGGDKRSWATFCRRTLAASKTAWVSERVSKAALAQDPLLLIGECLPVFLCVMHM